MQLRVNYLPSLSYSNTTPFLVKWSKTIWIVVRASANSGFLVKGLLLSMINSLLYILYIDLGQTICLTQNKLKFYPNFYNTNFFIICSFYFENFILWVDCFLFFIEKVPILYVMYTLQVISIDLYNCYNLVFMAFFLKFSIL